MKKLFDNKILLVVVLVSILILTSISNVFANEYTNNNNETVDIPDFNYLLTDTFPDYVIFKSNYGNNVRLIIYNNVGETGGRLYPDFDLVNDRLYFDGNNIRYVLENNEWSLSAENVGVDATTPDLVFLSSQNLYSTSGDLVFHLPELVPEITRTLAETTTQAEMGQTILLTVKSFLIYLVIFVVSMLAIYKAVKFLKSVLRAS